MRARVTLAERTLTVRRRDRRWMRLVRVCKQKFTDAADENRFLSSPGGRAANLFQNRFGRNRQDQRPPSVFWNVFWPDASAVEAGDFRNRSRLVWANVRRWSVNAANGFREHWSSLSWNVGMLATEVHSLGEIRTAELARAKIKAINSCQRRSQIK